MFQLGTIEVSCEDVKEVMVAVSSVSSRKKLGQGRRLVKGPFYLAYFKPRRVQKNYAAPQKRGGGANITSYAPVYTETIHLEMKQTCFLIIHTCTL